MFQDSRLFMKNRKYCETTSLNFIEHETSEPGLNKSIVTACAIDQRGTLILHPDYLAGV